MSVMVPNTYSPQQLHCVVKTDDPRYPEWTYRLRFTSVPRIRFDSDAVQVGSSSVSAGRSSVPAHLDVFSLGDGTASPGPPHLQPARGLTAALDPLPRTSFLPGGVRRDRYRVTVGLGRDDRALGPFALPLLATLTDGAAASVSVVGEVVGPLYARPAYIHFGVIDPAAGAAASPRSVTIGSADARPFRLISADAGPAGPRVRTRAGAIGRSSAPAPEHTLELTLPPPAAAGRSYLSGRVRIRTDLAEAGEVILAWSAFVRAREAGRDRLDAPHPHQPQRSTP